MKPALVRLLRAAGLEPTVIRVMRLVRAVPSRRPAIGPGDTWRDVIPPSGTTIESLRETMLSLSIDGSPRGALDPYVHDSFHRFLLTWSLVRDAKGRCLELGGNPYFTSLMLWEHTDLEVTIANYFGGPDAVGRQRVTWIDRGQERSREVGFDHFNMEEARFPYADDAFDVVLYCEIIEHLLMNPVHTLREIHRVLAPSGRLVLTTPNVARLGNVLAIIEGRGVYDPYSGFGPYGRHNREYTVDELIHLLRFVGFEVEEAFTADAHAEELASRPSYARATRLVSERRDRLGQYIFIVARVGGQPNDGLPASLFRSHPEGALNPAW